MRSYRRYLTLTAGFVWILAGVKILRIGLSTWDTHEPFLEFHMLYAGIIFILFFLMFQRILSKNMHRILQIEKSGNPLAFFDLKGWVIMFFMIGLGITVRNYQLLPPSFIAPFYSGLSSALFLTGISYLFKTRTVE
ncbi:MAG: hypothetical protein LUG51_00230 [Tannerellaceae bacterium]|nr:hypothetical protein [Tannerellaceae bacterium]